MKKRVEIAKKIVLVFTALFFVFAFPDVSMGDPGPIIIESATNITPAESTQISLAKENLSIRIGYGKGLSAYVDAEFVMENTGGPVNQKMGFPISGVAPPENFVVLVNGKEIPESGISRKKIEDNIWEIFEVHFEKGEEKVISVKYTVSNLTAPTFTYILKTGALWKGAIGVLNIKITLPEEAKAPFFLGAVPGGYTVSGSSITYRFENYEPKENITVEFLPWTFYEKIKPLMGKAYLTQNPESWFEFVKELLPADLIGPYGSRSIHGSFVNEYNTDGYATFVKCALDDAMFASKGSRFEKILKIVNAARFGEKGAFYSGVLGLKDFSKMESAFGESLEKPENKEIGRLVAYYWWWKANTLGEEGSSKAADALAKFLKFAGQYVPFKECGMMVSPEVVTQTPEMPWFREYIYSEKICADKKGGKVRKIEIDFGAPKMIRDYLNYYEAESNVLKGEANEISKAVQGAKFAFGGKYIAVMTLVAPSGKQRITESEIEKIKEAIKAAHSPFYVYPKAVLETVEENKNSGFLNVKSIKENAIFELNREKNEIESSVTDYWKKMENSVYYNTYAAAVKLPLFRFSKNIALLESNSIPDFVKIEACETGKQDSGFIRFLVALVAALFAFVIFAIVRRKAL